MSQGFGIRTTKNPTYSWPEDGDYDDKVSYDSEKPCRDETANSRHANCYCWLRQRVN